MRDLVRLFGYTHGLGRTLIVIVLLSVVTAVLNLAPPFVIKTVTDAIVAGLDSGNGVNYTIVFWLVMLLLVLSLVGTTIDNIGGILGDMLAARMRKQLSSRYYEHLLSLPQRYFDSEITGKIINRLNRAIADVTQFLQFFANNLLSMLLVVLISLGIMLWYSWPIAVFMLLLIPIFLYVTAKTSVKWQAYEKKKNHHYDIASGRFAEVVSQVRLVKSFNTEHREQQEFSRRFTKMVGITKKQSTYWHGMNAVRGVALSIIYALVFGTLFYQTASGTLTIGEMVLLIALVQQISGPLQSMSYFIDSYQRAVANSRDYAEAMNEKPETRDEKGKKALDATHAKIEFVGIGFAYDKKKQVLDDVSFVIKPGQKLALVGESGGGKTTISNLLMRLYSPTHGAVMINGHNIQDMTQASVRDSIATVFQDASLFSGTVRENIAYGRPTASDKDIEAAAKSANALDFVLELPDGLDTEIGERGIKLSGGQKQRIAIARALLKDAPILILDEATSSLDSRSESVVQEALERLMKNRTVLIIAHRLSTIAHVDTIVTLKHGRVDEVGAPVTLASTGGIYAQLLELQLATTEKAREKLAEFDIGA